MADKNNKCNVIIADDFDQDLELLALSLSRIGQFNIVLKARDGGDVIDYLEGKRPFNDRELFPWPHLLILDLKMLKVDGFDVLRWIQLHPTQPVLSLVLTGHDIQNYVATARELGADVVYIKPLSTGNVRDIVKRVEIFVERLEDQGEKRSH